MRYLSLCSGIEAASVAWVPLGWEPAAFAEIEVFPSAVLKAHYPSVPNLGDITRFQEWPDLGPVDLVCGGTPCQSFSVAGLRAGLADPRGNLMLTFLAIVGRYRPRWCLWENVPGVLSSGGGRDFGTFLSGLGQLGYGWAYRVLDAQYVRTHGFERAVPQRRRRVFVVGCLGDWARAAAVLSERQSLLGDTPPRRKAGQGAAPTISSRATAGGGLGTDFDCDGGLVPEAADRDADSADLIPSISNCLNARDDKGGRAEDNVGLVVTHSLRAEGFDASEDGTGRWVPLIADTMTSNGDAHSNFRDDAGLIMTLAIRGRDGHSDLETRDDGAANAILTPSGGRAGIGVGAVAIQERAISENPANGPDGKGWRNDGASYTVEARNPQAVAFTASEQANGFAWENDVWQTLDAQVPNDSSNIQKGVRQDMAVRRLTPLECERLMGFPDGYTDVPYRGKPASDGPRYRALGNSWAVNCVRWIGRRIEMVEAYERA